MATLVHSLLSITTTCINTNTITLINPYSSSSSSSSAFPLHQLRLIPSINHNTRTTLNMSLPTSQNPVNVSVMPASQQKITIPNNFGKKLVGILHETGSVEIVILWHGFRSTKERDIMVNIAVALEKEGITAFRFDFAGNGESEGSFKFVNYWREAEDLRAVIQHFHGASRVTSAILGHSKGGNVVLLYASKYHDIRTVVNVSSRYNLEKGIEEHFGKDFIERTKKEGYLDVENKKGSTSDTLEETDEITSDTSEEAQILADLLEANGVNKLFDKLEAPFVPSSLLLGTSSNEAASHIQKGLTISLQSMTDVNGMIAVTNNVFMILKSLGVDFTLFYEKVKIFLGCFALKTQLADSSNLSTAEFEAQYYEKKLHFDKVSGKHEQLSASIIKSDENIAGLNQRIIQTKELLKQLEEELSSTQAEHATFMCDFAQASESVSKSEEDVQTALNVLSQHKKKNGQYNVVERAFERAKASLNE